MFEARVSDPERAIGLQGAPAELLSLQALLSVFHSEGKERPQYDNHQHGAAICTWCCNQLHGKSPSCLSPFSSFFYQYEVTNHVSCTHFIWFNMPCSSDHLTCRGICPSTAQIIKSARLCLWDFVPQWKCYLMDFAVMWSKAIMSVTSNWISQTQEINCTQIYLFAFACWEMVAQWCSG